MTSSDIRSNSAWPIPERVRLHYLLLAPLHTRRMLIESLDVSKQVMSKLQRTASPVDHCISQFESQESLM